MPNKPEKPSADFPLFPHASGKWAKKIKGKLKYFGRWSDPAGALVEYQTFTRAASDRLSDIESVCQAFLESKQVQVDAGELSQHSLSDYRRTCSWIKDRFGAYTAAEKIGSPEFSQYKAVLARRRSLISLKNEMIRVRTVFRWAHRSGRIPAPVFGPDFVAPSLRAIRRHMASLPTKLYTADQINALLDESGVQLRAMILLGINCAYGPGDCAALPRSAVDLLCHRVSFARPKTSTPRVAPLWPETCSVLAEVFQRCPGASTAFLLPSGRPWTQNDISKRFQRARKAAGLKLGGFYWLRHTFATVAGDSGDQVAVNLVMGHADNSMAGQYQHRVAWERLQAVSERVRTWLLSYSPNKSGTSLSSACR